MIDVHCHLNFPKFHNDIEEVIERAWKSGVKKIINVGTSIQDSQAVVKLSKSHDDLYAIIGVHPHDADKLNNDWIYELEQLSKEPKVVGIGEIGLDYFQHEITKPVDKKIQQEIFIKQIELSIKLKLPLQIHSRKAAKDIIEILKSYKNKLLNTPGMFHCMAGNVDYLRNVLDLGFYVGFDGNITYDGLAPGEDTPLRDLIKFAPIDRIVTETDAPFLTPIPHRGKRNEPSYVIIIGEFIGNIKATPFDKVEEITTKNAYKLFKL